MLINVLAAIYLIVHGLIHLIGFVTNFQIAEIEEITYSTTVLAGRLEIGDVGTRVLGIAWLLGCRGLRYLGGGHFLLTPLVVVVYAGGDRSLVGPQHIGLARR